MDLTPHLEHRASLSSEDVYDLATRYRFARRYVADKVVADIGWEGVGYGSWMLAGAARSVVGLTSSSRAVDLASGAHAAPNISYQEANLPSLPCSRDLFDAVIALGVVEHLEHPEDLVREAKRVLKHTGVLVVSTVDRQIYSNDRNHRDPEHRREMYVPEFRELLERHFKYVRMYRQGAVAGGLVFRDSGQVSAALVENTRLSLTNPTFDGEPPTVRFVIAVCSDAESSEQEDDQPYLLLDRDRRVFDECEDRTEDVELMVGEVHRLQETEVQAFQDTLKFLGSEVDYLKTQLERAEARAQNSEARRKSLKIQYESLRVQHEDLKSQYENQNFQHKSLRIQYENLKSRHEDLRERHENLNSRHETLKGLYDSLKGLHEDLRVQHESSKNRLQSLENSNIWKFFEPYRRLRNKLSPP